MADAVPEADDQARPFALRQAEPLIELCDGHCLILAYLKPGTLYDVNPTGRGAGQRVLRRLRAGRRCQVKARCGRGPCSDDNSPYKTVADI